MYNEGVTWLAQHWFRLCILVVLLLALALAAYYVMIIIPRQQAATDDIHTASAGVSQGGIATSSIHTNSDAPITSPSPRNSVQTIEGILAKTSTPPPPPTEANSNPVTSSPSTSATTSTPPPPPITVNALPSDSTTADNGVITFDIKFAVTTTDTTIDVPQSSVGVQYQISNVEAGTQSTFTLNCPSTATYEGTSYCEVPPNTTADFELIATVPTTATASQSGSPQLSVSEIKYYTNVNSGSESFNYYQPKGLVTSDYIGYQN
jgi:hypothetical protein